MRNLSQGGQQAQGANSVWKTSRHHAATFTLWRLPWILTAALVYGGEGTSQFYLAQ